MNLKYSVVFKDGLLIYIVLVNSKIVESNSINYWVSKYAKVLETKQDYLVLAGKTPLGKTEYIYGKENIISKLIDVDPNELTWNTIKN